jgi:hypothetical protein
MNAHILLGLQCLAVKVHNMPDCNIKKPKSTFFPMNKLMNPSFPIYIKVLAILSLS